jgi:ornithine cyclodeaminase
VLILDAGAATVLLDQLDVLEIVADALARYSAGEALVPPRLQVHTPDGSLESLIMPGWVGAAAKPGVSSDHGRDRGRDVPDGLTSMGLKVVNSLLATDPGSRSRSRAAILVFDSETGAVDGIVEATHLTAVRTAMMTKLALEYAAPTGARVVTLLGSGVQADAHVPIILDAIPALAELRVHSRLPENARAFADAARNRARAHGLLAIQVTAVDSPVDAVEGAEVVIAATTAAAPLYDDDSVAPGALLCSVGSHAPDVAEIPSASVARASSVIVDTRPGGVHGAGDISRPLAAGLLQDDLIVELGELVLGRRTLPARPADGKSDAAPVIFKSVGTAAIDLPLASLLVARARAAGLGHEVELG